MCFIQQNAVKHSRYKSILQKCLPLYLLLISTILTSLGFFAMFFFLFLFLTQGCDHVFIHVCQSVCVSLIITPQPVPTQVPKDCVLQPPISAEQRKRKSPV